MSPRAVRIIGGPFAGPAPPPPPPPGLVTVYLGADLPRSAEGQVFHDPNADPLTQEPFPGTVMNTYDGLDGPPVGSAYGFRDVPAADSAALIAAIAPGTLQDGDDIQLTPGVRYTGPFSNWETLSAWCRIGCVANMPPRDERATAAHEADMAIIECQNGPFSVVRAVVIPGGKGWVWFKGVKFEVNNAVATPQQLIQLGTQPCTNVSHIAEHVVFEHCLTNIDPAIQALKKFIVGEVHYLAILDTTVQEIFHGLNSPDSHVLAISQSSGPVKLINSKLNGASQSWLTGGAGFQNQTTPTGERPSDWEVRRCHCTKSVARKGLFYNNSGVAVSAGTPGAVEYTVKVCAEFKDMERALVVDTLFDQCWQSGQVGHGFSMTNYGVNGQNERCRDLVWAYLVISDTACGIQQYVDNSAADSQTRVVLSEILIKNFNISPTNGSVKILIQTTAAGAGRKFGRMVYRNITAYAPTVINMIQFGGPSPMVADLDIGANIMHHGSFGFRHADGGGGGTAGLTTAATVWNFLRNILTNPSFPSAYPSGNAVGPLATEVYVDGPGGDYRVSPTSLYTQYDIEGNDDAGGHIEAIEYRTRGCISGVWT